MILKLSKWTGHVQIQSAAFFSFSSLQLWLVLLVILLKMVTHWLWSLHSIPQDTNAVCQNRELTKILITLIIHTNICTTLWRLLKLVLVEVFQQALLIPNVSRHAQPLTQHLIAWIIKELKILDAKRVYMELSLKELTVFQINKHKKTFYLKFKLWWRPIVHLLHLLTTFKDVGKPFSECALEQSSLH